MLTVVRPVMLPKNPTGLPGPCGGLGLGIVLVMLAVAIPVMVTPPVNGGVGAKKTFKGTAGEFFVASPPLLVKVTPTLSVLSRVPKGAATGSALKMAPVSEVVKMSIPGVSVNTLFGVAPCSGNAVGCRPSATPAL